MISKWSAGGYQVVTKWLPSSYHLGTLLDRLGTLLQSGASSPAKHGGAYFSAVYVSIQDPIAAPGPYETQGTNPCEQK